MTIKLSIILAFSVLLTGCCWISGRENTQLFVPKEVSDMVPYSDQQPVIFLKSGGDTVRVKVSRFQGFQNESCAECYCSSKESELQEFTFFSPSDTLLNLRLSAEDPRLIFFSHFESFILTVNASGTVLCDSTSLAPVYCLDSLLVRGVNYKNVYKLEPLVNSLPGEDVSRIFYQASKGVVRIDYSDGTSLEIL
ncbi:MAG: hypothetical protein ABIQ93_15040 [Saprospiraceae bacterium]